MSYIKEVQEEAKKVVWPTYKQTVTNSRTTIIVVSFFALLFWAADSGLLKIMQEVISK